MKKFVFILILIFAIGVGAVSAQDDNGAGIAVDCDNGASFTNGVQITVVQMRSGFNYTATAVGLNGFDPVLAVLGEDGTGLCSDDESDADYYEAEFPTTGYVEPSRRTAQVVFSQRSREAMADVSIVVGSAEDSEGEVIVILEGMAATSADGMGDVFSVRLTENVSASEVPFTTYMISVTSAFDPLLAMITSDYEYVEDEDGNVLYCDDAGNEDICWGDSENLSKSGVSRVNGRVLAGGDRDAMLTLNPAGLDFEEGEWYYNFISSSYNQETYGDYLMVFHMGLAEVDGKTSSGGSKPSAGGKDN